MIKLQELIRQSSANIANIDLYMKLYNEVVDELFYKPYPDLFGDHTFDFSINPGWFQHIKKLINELTISGYSKSLKVVQVKEKFGSLRFYCHHTSSSTKYDEYSHIIHKYEEICSKTCDICGESGQIRTGSWMKTRCEKHK